MKTFVQYGAGSIGRGFIGAVFSLAGYHVKFIDVDMTIINALNERRGYPVEVVSNETTDILNIRNVAGVDGRDANAVADAIAGADIMATAIGVNILPRIVGNITAGLRRRWENGNDGPFNIIICENLIDADKFLRKLITEQLSDGEKEKFEKTVGLVEASIGRMVPPLTAEMKQQDCLRVRVEKYSMLPVDKAAFKGEIPDVKNLCPFSPFEFFIRRKLFVHNMGHALTAYTGFLLGSEYIWQAIGNPVVKLMAQRAMTESVKALSSHFDVPLVGLLDNIDDLLARFGNAALGDTVARVGKDTKRKLSASDRLAGAAKLCEAEGFEPVYICAGLAAGLFFNPEGADDPGTAAVQAMLAEKGLDAVLSELCGFDRSPKAAGYVRGYYQLLKSGAGLDKLFAQCEANRSEALDGKHIV